MYFPLVDEEVESRRLPEAAEEKLLYLTEKVQPACSVSPRLLTPPVNALYVFPSKTIELPEVATKEVSCLSVSPPLPVTLFPRNKKLLLEDSDTLWPVYEVETM